MGLFDNNSTIPPLSPLLSSSLLSTSSRTKSHSLSLMLDIPLATAVPIAGGLQSAFQYLVPLFLCIEVLVVCLYASKRRGWVTAGVLLLCFIILDISGCRVGYLECVEEQVGDVWRNSGLEWDKATPEDWVPMGANDLKAYAEQATERRQHCLVEARRTHHLGAALSKLLDNSRGSDQEAKLLKLRLRADHDLLRSSKRTNHFVNMLSLSPLLLALLTLCVSIVDIYSAIFKTESYEEQPPIETTTIPEDSSAVRRR